MDARRIVILTSEERAQLQRLLQSGTSPARLLTRARILLLLDRSLDDHRSVSHVAKLAFSSDATVKRLRSRFLDEGLEAALHDKHRGGAPPKLTGEKEAQLFLLACSAPPEGHARWSLRLLADRMVELGHVESVSHVTVREHLKRGRSSPGR